MVHSSVVNVFCSLLPQGPLEEFWKLYNGQDEALLSDTVYSRPENIDKLNSLRARARVCVCFFHSHFI